MKFPAWFGGGDCMEGGGRGGEGRGRGRGRTQGMGRAMGQMMGQTMRAGGCTMKGCTSSTSL